MSSFNRDDYRRVFELAVYIWEHHGKGSPIEQKAEEIMDLCVRVIGQQADDPRRPR